jgi:hypothetical protein
MSSSQKENTTTITANNKNSFHLFTCLTTARYGQLQPSTKTAVQVNIKKQ